MSRPGGGVGSGPADAASGGASADGSPSAEFWEPLYQRSTDPGRGRCPNPALVTVLTELGLAPGAAWDLGCGHGGDALWLASLGWRVTATDVSATAVGRVAAAAAERGLGGQVATECHDLASTQPAGPFDLVYACYFHSWVAIDRVGILRRAAGRVGPGCFVQIDHASAAPWAWRREGEDEPEFPTPQQTLSALGLGPGWETMRCERTERTATGPDGQTATVADNIVVLRRA